MFARSLRPLVVGVGSALLTLLASSAFADGPYAGFGVGRATAKDDFTQIRIPTDDTDSGGKFFVGYKFERNAGIEIGYADLGEFVGRSGTTYSDTFRAKAITAALVGQVPASDNVALLFRLGFANWDVEDTIRTGGSMFPASDTGIDLTYGIGAQLNFSKTVGMRVEWEQFADVGTDTTTGKTGIDLLSASLVFGF